MYVGKLKPWGPEGGIDVEGVYATVDAPDRPAIDGSGESAAMSVHRHHLHCTNDMWTFVATAELGALLALFEGFQSNSCKSSIDKDY